MTEEIEVAARHAMLHERVAVLERDKRDMNDAYSAKCREARELREELERTRRERDELREAFNAVCDALGVPTDWKPIFSAGAATGEIEGMQLSAFRMKSKLDRIRQVLDE